MNTEIKLNKKFTISILISLFFTGCATTNDESSNAWTANDGNAVIDSELSLALEKCQFLEAKKKTDIRDASSYQVFLIARNCMDQEGFKRK